MAEEGAAFLGLWDPSKKSAQRGLGYSQFVDINICSFGRNGECFAPQKKKEAIPASGGIDEYTQTVNFI